MTLWLSKLWSQELLQEKIHWMGIRAHGERSCSVDLLVELSCILHVSTDYLLMGSEPGKEKIKNELLDIISELTMVAKKI